MFYGKEEVVRGAELGVGGGNAQMFLILKELEFWNVI